MRCSYCDIAYALPDPNCRGCGAPKTADAVRRDLELERERERALPVQSFAYFTRKDAKPTSPIEALLRRGPTTLAAIFFLAPLALIFGPFGLIALFFLVPKLFAPKPD